MVLDCDKYRINVEPIRLMLEDKDDKERLEFIGMLALATGVHIIIVCHYVGELHGFTDKLNEKIERYKKFYNIEHVINVRKHEV